MFFCSMVDLALVNTYILWKLITKNNSYTDHASFNEAVATELLNLHIGIGTRSRSSTPSSSTKNKAS